jgi:hypothetical protein
MWFDSWDERWYTGFTVVSYPRGSQQSIALISHAVGLLKGFVLVQLAAILLVVVGVYRFSRLWVGVEASGYAAVVSLFATSIAETVHVFGQLPTMLSLGFLLNALPYLDRWLRDASVSALSIALAGSAATTATHHLTCIFGTIFFGGPVIVSAVVDVHASRAKSAKSARSAEGTSSYVHWRRRQPHRLKRAWLASRSRWLAPILCRAAVFGLGVRIALIVVLPCWLWSARDPITQIPIPHASRRVAGFIHSTYQRQSRVLARSLGIAALYASVRVLEGHHDPPVAGRCRGG